MGPTILTVPRVLRRIYAEAGRTKPRAAHGPAGPAVALLLRGRHPESTSWGRWTRWRAPMDTFAPGKGTARATDASRPCRAPCTTSRERFFFWKPVEDLFDTIDFRADMNPDTLRDVMALRMGRTMAPKVIRGHVPDARLAQMLDHYCQYVGSSPYLAPAVLCSIGDMQAAEGVWYPRGGTRAVAEGLAKLAADNGADLRTGVEVTGFEVENGAVVAVRAGNERIACDAVVSNMDAIRTYRELLGGKAGARYGRKFKPACSGVVLYLGLEKPYEHLATTTSSSATTRRRSSLHLPPRRTGPGPDSVPGRRPPATDPSVAPGGGTALYVLVHTPHLRPGQDWARMLPAYRQTILDKLKRTAGMEDGIHLVVISFPAHQSTDER